MTQLAPGLTVRRRSRRSGRLEVWEAASTEQHEGRPVWLYVRQEDTSTTWLVVHTPSDRSLLCGSLPDARRWTASGDALAQLDYNEAAAARRYCWHVSELTRTYCPRFAEPERDFCPVH